MKANELRIGNLVNLCFEHRPGWDVASVTDIFRDGTIETDTQELTGKQKYYVEPLPLTEDWLLRAGFTYHNSYNVAGIKQSHWVIIGNQFGRLEIWSSEQTNEIKFNAGFHDYVTVQYVHQLQNLYFALTGEELTIK